VIEMVAPSPEAVAIDSFLSIWLAQNLDPAERQSFSLLAQKCRLDASAFGFTSDAIERRLGATIEEAIVVAANGLRIASAETGSA
jgi:hypothetical protein